MIIWIHCLIISLELSSFFDTYFQQKKYAILGIWVHTTLIPFRNMAISQSSHSTKPLICIAWIVGMPIEERKTNWNIWIKKQAQCYFILKFQNITYKYWTGFHHTSHSKSSKSLTLWMEPSAATAQPLTENLKSKRFKIYFTTSINQSSSATFTDLKVWTHIFFKSVDSLLNRLFAETKYWIHEINYFFWVSGSRGN